MENVGSRVQTSTIGSGGEERVGIKRIAPMYLLYCPLGT